MDNLRILVVGNLSSASFVDEHIQSLKNEGCYVETFNVKGKGIRGYLSNLGSLKRKIREFCPDIISAHYGLSGLLANLQRKCPVVTTYIGSDLHSSRWILALSRINMWLSKYNVFVSKYLQSFSGRRKSKTIVIPYGTDTGVFYPVNKYEARLRLNKPVFEENDNIKYVLFTGSFANAVKNYELARLSVKCLNAKYGFNKKAVLLELRGFSREQVALLLNSVDCLLVTSFKEGCPMIVKEAMAVGCPIVSVDVGDVKEMVTGLDGCYIVEKFPEDIAKGIGKALEFKEKTKGPERILEWGLDLSSIAKKLIVLYKSLL